jgi:hypothetical protein
VPTIFIGNFRFSILDFRLPDADASCFQTDHLPPIGT